MFHSYFLWHWDVAQIYLLTVYVQGMGVTGLLELLRGTQATGTLQCHGRMGQIYHNFLEF